MKIKTISESLSVVTIGISVGLIEARIHERWYKLGLGAFLSHETQTYQRLFAMERSAVYEIFLWVLTALTVFALYKGITLIVERILSAVVGEKSAVQI